MKAVNPWSAVLQRRVSRRRALAATGLSGATAGFVLACGGGDSGSNGAATAKEKSSLLARVEDTTKASKAGRRQQVVHTAGARQLRALRHQQPSGRHEASRLSQPG